MEQEPYKNTGRLWTGLFLIAAGVLLFAYKMGAPLPEWLFTWPVALIAFGVLLCIRHNFRNAGGIILIVVGGLNLVDRLHPELNFHNYVAPIIIIAIGVIVSFKPRKPCRHGRKWREEFMNDSNSTVPTSPDENKNEDAYRIDSTSVFGSVKKNIVSKNFRGGEIICFMGGAEYNLSQADIHGEIVLDVTQIFGGTKLIVPANWQIKTEVISVFGGIEDKRPLHVGNTNYDKVLVLIGTSVFGGIDIRSY